MATVVKDLGAVTAYAYAVEQGYTGTEEEFAQLMASYADVAEDAAASAQAAAASEAAASASEQAAAASEQAAAGSASSASADAATAASAASTATQQAGIATSGAGTATQKAADAAASAQDAASSETAAAGSAAAAATSETNAETAETAAQTAQAAAEAAAQSVSESAAQIEENKEDIADLKSAIDTYLVTEFSDYTLTTGYLIKASDGARTSHSEYSATLEYIPVSSHEIVGIHAYWSGNSGVAFYDKNFEYIGGVDSSLISSGEHTFKFSVPNGAVYMRFSNRHSYVADANVKVYEYAPRIEKRDVKTTLANDEAQLYGVVNYNIMLTVGKHTGYCNHNGTIDASSTNYRYTDPIPVTPGETLYGTTMRFVTYYDAQKEYVSGVNNPGASFTVPSGVAYVIVSYNYVELVPYPVLSRVNTTGFFTAQAQAEIQKLTSSNVFSDKLSSVLFGKKIAVFGDSIIYGDGNSNVGIGDILATKYNMTLYKYAVSGATMGVLDARHSHIADQVQYAINASVTPDIVIFDGGTNDMNGTNPNCPLGDVTDVYSAPSSESTFSAGFETAAYKLKTAFPNALIIYVRTGNISGRRYDRQIEYGERGIDICHKWGIIVADVYNILNTNLSQYSGFMNDATHPNGDGYTYFYIPEIERQILSWFSTYPNS